MCVSLEAVCVRPTVGEFCLFSGPDHNRVAVLPPCAGSDNDSSEESDLTEDDEDDEEEESEEHKNEDGKREFRPPLPPLLLK